MRTHRRALMLPALAVVAVLAAGCGSSSTSGDAGGSPSGSPSATDHSSMDGMSMAASPSPSQAGSGTSGSATGSVTLVIKDFAYSGADKVAPGATVTVRNDDSVAHTVTADSAGGFDVTVAPGKTATFTAPSKPGDYPYHCTYHGNMHGTLTVG
ncbi:MAG: cupredoxin domain-containing protein [Marmoricola sp.]